MLYPGLRVGGRQTLGVLDLQAGRLGLLLRRLELAPGVIELLLGLLGDLLARLLKLPLGVLGKFLLRFRGLARALLFQLLAEIHGLLRGLLLGLAPCVIGPGAALLRRHQLGLLPAGKIGEEAAGM